EEVQRLTRIDPWFLDQIKEIVELEMELDDRRLEDIDKERFKVLKRKGFSDRRLAYLFNSKEELVRQRRRELGIRPVYKRVDTCAAEFATRTAYLYSTYEEECEANPTALHLRGGVRGESHRQEESDGARRRAEPHRAGHRVRLLLRARRACAAR